MTKDSVRYALQPGSAVYVQCSPGDEWLPNVIKHINEDTVRINLREEYFNRGIMIGNFISLRFSHSDNEYVIEGQVTDIDIYETYEIGIFINNVNVYKNRRKHFRYYAKLGSSIKTSANDRGTYSIITNISSSGLALISKADLNVNISVLIDLFISSKNIVPLKGTIIRKKALNYGYEYGVTFHAADADAQEKINSLIDKLENQARHI